MAAVSAHTRRYGIPTMLPRILSVRADQDDGVRDYEAFCQAIVELAQRKEKIPPLEPCDLAVAVGFLLGQLAVVEPGYDAEKQRKPYLRFDLWLRTALYFDLIDFWRSPAGFGRHGQHRVTTPPETLSDDDSWNIDPKDPLEHADQEGTNRLERAIAEFTVDAPEPGDVTGSWLLPDGGRQAAERQRHVGRRSRTSAEKRAREADRVIAVAFGALMTTAQPRERIAA